jgi:hypothetical protein
MSVDRTPQMHGDVVEGYEPPRLIVIASVEEATLGSTSGTFDAFELVSETA